MSAIVISIVIGLIVNECCDVSPWCARKLVRWSAHVRYADLDRAATRAEELAALIDARPGKLLKLFTAAGFMGSAVLAAFRRSLARSQAPAGEPPQGIAASPVPALPGLVDIAGPLNLVASPFPSGLTARKEHARDGSVPDIQRFTDYLVAELRLMSTGDGVPARLVRRPGLQETVLVLYTSGYVLTSFVTKYGDAYAIKSVRPITRRDRVRLAEGALRLRPATWSCYPNLCELPQHGDSRWSLLTVEWGRLHPENSAEPDGTLSGR